MTKEIIIDAQDRSKRIDFVLTGQLEGYSRSQVKKLFDDGLVTLGGKKLSPSDKISGLVEVNIEQSSKITVNIPVIYKDEDVIVIDKPSGILTHSKGGLNNEYTVADFIEPLTTDSSIGRPGIVHRLDRPTSGVMILARSEKARVMLQKQFSRRTTRKQYLVLVEGAFKPKRQRYEWPIGRNPKKPSTFRVDANGKEAVTEVEAKKSGKRSLLISIPKTGRTHQIRVHLANGGHPIIGDRIYGGQEAKRLMLHAWKLQITIPSGDNHTFEAPMPSEFK